MSPIATKSSALEFFQKYCSEEWMPLIQHYIEKFHVQKNMAFIREGDPVSGIYFLCKGKVKITSRFHTNEERILRLVNEGMLLGHRGLFLSHFAISAVALTPCEVSFIPLNLFLQLYKTNPALSLYMLNFLTGELRESEEQQFILTLDNVRQRVAYCLVKLVRMFGYEKKGSPVLSFTLSRKDIATLGNTTYESVIRTLSAFEREGLVETNGKNISVLKEEQLRAIALGK